MQVVAGPRSERLPHQELKQTLAELIPLETMQRASLVAPQRSLTHASETG